ncbi:hypothetical protein BofuT4_uP062730.1 [Botrytis cinerea T4]|uniref:Uncharacterized protein n=1 Tax=Botryotinia fuckeliana (strain T4) TaxID=999810 RepID=G2XTK7_BOTF4|nr:hypothetical protein BofuT4_uP062730.1 [Botrytis cinerea T4]
MPPRKVAKPRDSRPRAAKVIEIGSEVANNGGGEPDTIKKLVQRGVESLNIDKESTGGSGCMD